MSLADVLADLVAEPNTLRGIGRAMSPIPEPDPLSLRESMGQTVKAAALCPLTPPLQLCGLGWVGDCSISI